MKHSIWNGGVRGSGPGGGDNEPRRKAFYGKLYDGGLPWEEPPVVKVRGSGPGVLQ